MANEDTVLSLCKCEPFTNSSYALLIDSLSYKRLLVLLVLYGDDVLLVAVLLLNDADVNDAGV